VDLDIETLQRRHNKQSRRGDGNSIRKLQTLVEVNGTMAISSWYQVLENIKHYNIKVKESLTARVILKRPSIRKKREQHTSGELGRRCRKSGNHKEGLVGLVFVPIILLLLDGVVEVDIGAKGGQLLLEDGQTGVVQEDQAVIVDGPLIGGL